MHYKRLVFEASATIYDAVVVKMIRGTDDGRLLWGVDMMGCDGGSGLRSTSYDITTHDERTRPFYMCKNTPPINRKPCSRWLDEGLCLLESRSVDPYGGNKSTQLEDSYEYPDARGGAQSMPCGAKS